MSEWVYAVDYSKGDFVDFYTRNRDNHYQLYKGDIFSIDNDEPISRIDGKIVRFQEAEVPGDLKKNFIVYKKKLRTRGMVNKFAESENIMSFKEFLDLIAQGRLIMIGDLELRKQRYHNKVAKGMNPVDDEPARDDILLPPLIPLPIRYKASSFRTPQVKEEEEEEEDDPEALSGGRNKKRHFRKSKKSKRTKRSRSVRRSRSRKGGMTHSEIKDKIKNLVLDKVNKKIDDIEYRANYDYIYSLWSSLGSKENKEKFAEKFVEAANTLFKDHSYRVPLYETIIADLRATDSHIMLHPEDLRMHKYPRSLIVIHGGKSTRRRHNRRSSKKYKKARKSRRRVRS